MGKPVVVRLDIRDFFTSTAAKRVERVFRRIGWDIYIDLPIRVSEAVLGVKIEIPTLEGTTKLTVPAGTSSGMRLRLKGKGIRDPRTNKRGDLYAVVKVSVPKKPTRRLRELAEQFGEADTVDPRKRLW